ncbi:MAG: GGDEF domain-containing protein [Catenulispora sp.]
MSAQATAIVAAGIGVAGFLLGSVSAWQPVRRLREELTRFRHLAEHDPLTGLPNRGAAQRHFRHQTATGRACAAVLVDLDEFKAVNDTWGHHAGDAHLTVVADRLAAGCRPIGGFAARLAGDEFLLLLPPADSDTVLRQVTTLLDRLGAPVALPVNDTATITCTPGASAGIALAGPDTAWADLLRRADIALYQAKTRRGRATLYTPGMFQPPPATPTSGPAHARRTATAGAGGHWSGRDRAGITGPAMNLPGEHRRPEEPRGHQDRRTTRLRPRRSRRTVDTAALARTSALDLN